MFSLIKTENWLENVVKQINKTQLNIENCTFMIALFSSLDNEVIDYFYENHERINKASGKGFHIFTPFIYKERSTLTEDDHVRQLRNEFKSLGFPLNTNPTFVFFKIKNYDGSKPEPKFIGIYSPKHLSEINIKIRDSIETSFDIKNEADLAFELAKIFESPNILSQNQISRDFTETITKKLPKKKIFVSYSSQDREKVNQLISQIDTTANFWIDHVELGPGDKILDNITKNTRDSDYLILFLSKSSANSEWVKFEIAQFSGDDRRIIPIYLDSDVSLTTPYNQILQPLNSLLLNDENERMVLDKIEDLLNL